jgi:methylmalonyl-CoA/ethylmalonyl-CoA epimerase
MNPADPGLKRLAQVAIICRDIEKSSVRWAAVLGVPVPKNFMTPPGLERANVYRGKPTNAQCKLAFFQLENISIELIQPLGPGSAWQEGLDANGESVHHLAFKVDDLAKGCAHFVQQGFPEIHRGRWGGDDGTYVYFDSAKQLGVMVEVLHGDPKK